MNETSDPKDVVTQANLEELIRDSNVEGIRKHMQALEPGETARAILQLGRKDQTSLMKLLSPEEAADMIREVDEEQAADVMEELDPTTAAAIVDELASDERADVLGEMQKGAAEAVLEEMETAQAQDAKSLMKYGPETAGGLMVTEYLAYGGKQSLKDVVADLRVNRERYADYDVQYIYVTDGEDRLIGVLRMRDLLFERSDASLEKIMIRNPISIKAADSLDNVNALFEQHRLMGLPVVDEQGVLLGVVHPEAVEEALGRRTSKQFLRISGIIAGEEFRSMGLFVRSGRRFAWLLLNIFMNIFAAGVISLYLDTIQSVVALAIFLPIISDMSGCTGNQAVAVSIRELSLGLIRPGEYLKVLFKEAGPGIINGLALGVVLAIVAFIWKGNFYLALVVGLALAVNTLFSACIGGLLPLMMKKLRLDPALSASPILTSISDACGFFLLLNFAALAMSKLNP